MKLSKYINKTIEELKGKTKEVELTLNIVAPKGEISVSNSSISSNFIRFKVKIK